MGGVARALSRQAACDRQSGRRCAARLDTPVPVARGFATWGTDSGHDNAKLPEIQAFGLNAEALENYAFASYKKVHAR
jgi:hypothetical protein